MGRLLCLVPRHNSKGKHDVSGAFLPEALRFASARGEPTSAVQRFDNRRGLTARRREVLEVFERLEEPVDTVAFFCHGWRDGLQAGFRKRHVGLLAEAIAAHAAEGTITVLLYACDTGRDGDGARDDDRGAGPGGDGGFADALRDALQTAGVHALTYAHTTAGHTTQNPYVRVFGSVAHAPPTTGEGGLWVVEPRSEQWRPWRRRLWGHPRFRFDFAYMSREQIAEELTKDVA